MGNRVVADLAKAVCARQMAKEAARRLAEPKHSYSPAQNIRPLAYPKHPTCTSHTSSPQSDHKQASKQRTCGSEASMGMSWS